MPLPDERPRQSVANLIGRFEQQNKKQQSAAANAVPTRSSSVASQHTGDAVKEELKEKREWPPKPKQVFSSAIESRGDVFAKSPEAPAPASLPEPEPAAAPDSDPAPEVPTEPVLKEKLEESASISSVILEKVASPTPPSSPPKKTAAASKPASARPSTTTARTPGTPSKTRESRPSTFGAKPAVRTPAKSPPSSYHPGMSTSASIPAMKAPGPTKATPSRPRPSSRASITPSRPKTPSASRPKTPAHTTSPRPKTTTTTPSSGLFAPTAASLARARNSDGGPPQPIRKPTASKESLERLSKPTAASMSKARAPPMPAVPTKSTAVKSTPVTRGITPAARGGAVVKPRAGVAAAKVKDGAGTTKIASAAAVGAAAVVAATAEVASQETEDHHPENIPKAQNGEMANHEHEPSDGALVDEQEHVEPHEPEEVVETVGGTEEHQEEPHDVHREETSPENVGEQQEESVTNEQSEEIAEPDSIEHEQPAEEPSHVVADEPITLVESHTTDDIPAATTETESDAVHSESETHVDTESDTVAGSVATEKSVNDLEDMVAFLESAPLKPLPITTASILDEVDDIPDEE